MTAIAYRNGIMAGDSRTLFTGADNLKVGTRKLVRVGKYVVGVAGEVCPSDGQIVECLFKAKLPRETPQALAGDKWDFSALVAGPGVLFLYESMMHGRQAVREPFFAIGGGAEVCMGALEMGASAVEAVTAACKWAATCDFPVHQERV